MAKSSLIPTKDQAKMIGVILAAGMSLSAAFSAAFLTAPSEGDMHKAYQDSGGVVTVCYGHTGPEVKLGEVYTEAQCLALLMKDTGDAEVQVKKLITVPLNVYQTAALDDFVYNEGASKLKKSTMRRKFNAHDYKGGCEELTKWVMAGGHKLRGLETRRDKEMAFCLGQVEVIYNAK